MPVALILGFFILLHVGMLVAIGGTLSFWGAVGLVMVLAMVVGALAGSAHLLDRET